MAKKRGRKAAAKAKGARRSRKKTAVRTGASVLGTAQAVGQLVNVELSKQDGSPDQVRVVLKHYQAQDTVIIAPGATQGTIPNVPVGSFVVVWVFVNGNPKQTATIAVTGATPSLIKVAVPDNGGQGAEGQALLVTG